MRSRAAIESPKNIVLVSTANAWEIVISVRSGD
jgi:PIN domain nuclease of toxin-antitoxin system